ncbi:MAG: hypothetical protein QXW98_05735 [Candidatus Caldarchaeum sp.]
MLQKRFRIVAPEWDLTVTTNWFGGVLVAKLAIKMIVDKMPLIGILEVVIENIVVETINEVPPTFIVDQTIFHLSHFCCYLR